LTFHPYTGIVLPLVCENFSINHLQLGWFKELKPQHHGVPAYILWYKSGLWEKSSRFTHNSKK